MMEKELRIISKDSLLELIGQWPECSYLAILGSSTVLMFDKDDKHLGSIYLKGEGEKNE